MPPPSTPTGLSRTPQSTSNDVFTQLSKIILAIFVAVSCIRLAILHYARRKRRTSTSKQSVQEKDPRACQELVEKDPRHRTISESSNKQQPPTFRPIYPWVSPPQPLPGPYDPRLYPLPTVRRHSSANPSPNSPEESNQILYTRRVSTNSIPSRQSTIHGSVTTSSKGWRRNQWVVSGG